MIDPVRKFYYAIKRYHRTNPSALGLGTFNFSMTEVRRLPLKETKKHI